jgi:putative addiction module killer protein
VRPPSPKEASRVSGAGNSRSAAAVAHSICCLRGNIYGTDAYEYEDRDGQSPFASWFNTLDAKAAAKVRLAMAKLEAGLKPNVKSVGKGVHEARIDFGPGYRAYFAFDGTELILLLGGGEKHGQDDDIAAAQE